MEAQEILASLHRRGAVLDIVDGELRCRAPKGVLTPELVRQLKTHKPEIVQLVGHVTSPAQSAPLADAYPLTFAQRRLWFLELLNGPSPTYNTYGVFRVTGTLHAEALRISLNKIVRRHPVLTACFADADGEPVQVPRPGLVVEVPVIDATTLDGAALEQLVASEGRRPFDLSRDCLIRLVLVRCAPQSHLLLLNMHHIVADGWSLAVFVGELSALYTAEVDGRIAVLPVLTKHYFDYALAERSAPWEQRVSQHLAYWRERLANLPPALDLWSAHERPAVQTYAGAFEAFWLDGAARRKLAELCVRMRTTPFAVLLSAFKVLLARYSGQRDIVVGTITAHRPSAEAEKLIGFFANTIAVRCDLGPEHSFEQLVRQVQQASAEAFAHEDAPFERVVQALAVERDLSFTPVFQVLFLMQGVAAEPARLGDLSIEPIEHDNGVAKYDLTLSVSEAEDGLRCGLQYRLDLFDVQTIRQLIASYRCLLEAALARPQTHIHRLPIVAAAQPSSIVRAASRPQGTAKCLHTLFEAHCRQAPERTALLWDGGSITYGELNARANRVAHALLSMGVRRESRIGLWAHPTPQMLVGMLAIMKAGASYVPLDPAYPADRLSYIATDAGVRFVLTQAEDREALAAALPASAAMIDLHQAAQAGPTDNPPLQLDAAQAAYLIYTSGSTGRPKGVVVTHENVARLLTQTDCLFDFSEHDVWTLFHSFAFDFSVWEIWGALSHGATVSIVPYATRYDPNALLDWIEASGVTVLSQTPSAFARLYEALERNGGQRALALRYVVFGGESLNPASSIRWAGSHALRGVKLVNMYGITETTVHVTFLEVDPAPARLFDNIGRPIADLEVYVLDEHLQPVPAGVRGEMYVAGRGLARGYLGRPGLTAERFVPNPFATAGERMYRTGDCGRLHHSGVLEYLGRSDRQVNIRGFRIELAEIEAALRDHPDVCDAVVLETRDERAEQQLTAYLVERLGATLDVAQLYERMRGRLPSFMIPAQLKLIERVPMTSNGKVDQSALRESDAPVRARATFTQPRDATEAALVRLFEDTLGRERVGIHDNFFALGGDSISSISVIAQAHRRALPLELQDLFRFQTPAALSTAVRTRQLQKSVTATEPFALVSEQVRALLPAHIEDAYPLTALQAGMLFHSERDAEGEYYHNVSYLRLKGQIEPEAFETAVGAAVQRHPVLRTSLWRGGSGEPLQLVHRAIELPIRFIDLTHLGANERVRHIEEMIARERAERFDSSRAPLFRLLVHRLGPGECCLTWVEHHLILDGWSVATLFTEIFQDYFALGAGASARLPAPATSFRDYVAAERLAAQSAVSREFWRSSIAALAPAGLPPASDGESPGQRAGGAGERIVLAADLSQRLRRLATEIDVPLKSVLLAAHLYVFAAVTGASDVLTGLVSNGRLETQDGERVLGLFLNTIPFGMRLGRGGPRSWRDLIHSAYAGEIATLEHRRFPMPDMRSLQPDGVLFDTAFNYMNFHVLGRLREHDGLEVLEARNFQRNSIPLMANWRDDTASGELTLTISYDAARLSSEQIRRIGGYHVHTLSEMGADAGSQIARFALLERAERALLCSFNQTSVLREDCQLVHARIERQAACRPDATALRLDDERLSYGELNARANRLAHHLIREGVGVDGLVGVCLERSFDLIIACLAALKAGAAMVLIDPEQPLERLLSIVRDARLDALIADAARGEIGARSRIPVIDPAAAKLAGFSTSDPGRRVHPANLAYVVFTSGTTGKPKGAMNTHQALCNQIDWMQSAHRLDATDVVLQKTPISFDVSVWELTWALCAGAQIALVRAGGHRDPFHVLEALRRHAVTLCHFVPSMLRLFLDAVGGEKLPPTLRTVICSGEALPQSLRHDFFGVAADRTKLNNLYGPAEASIDVTYWPCPRGSAQSTLIGRPVDNTQLFVVHENWQLAPLGTAGELCIGGVGLGRGYLHRPDLTAERFVPNPWSDEPGARLYRTGDRVRYTPQGELEYLGRTDNQVKIGGCRIEPEEVERTLTALPGVRAAAVAVHETSPGQKALVACVVMEPGTAQAERDLHRALRARLPGYMCPASIMALDALPVGPNGKVDRRALLRQIAAPTAVNEGRAPQGETERRVAQIWSRVLGGVPIDLDSHFFDSGGNSLRAMQVIAAIRNELAVDVPIARLFDQPRLYDFALETLRLRLQATGSEQQFMEIAAQECDARIEAIYRSVTPQ